MFKFSIPLLYLNESLDLSLIGHEENQNDPTASTYLQGLCRPFLRKTNKSFFTGISVKRAICMIYLCASIKSSDSRWISLYSTDSSFSPESGTYYIIHNATQMSPIWSDIWGFVMLAGGNLWLGTPSTDLSGATPLVAKTSVCLCESRK